MTDTITLTREPVLSADETYRQALQQTFERGVSHHRAGQLQEAEQLYRAILQAEPQHPEANHNLGVLAVERHQPAAGLPHFEAALAAKPESERYWLSYIEALIHAGQTDLAQQVLALGRQHGLQGQKADALEEKAGLRTAEPSGADEKTALKTTQPDSNRGKRNGSPPLPPDPRD